MLELVPFYCFKEKGKLLCQSETENVTYHTTCRVQSSVRILETRPPLMGEPCKSLSIGISVQGVG